MNSFKKYIACVVCAAIILTQIIIPFSVNAAETEIKYDGERLPGYVTTDTGAVAQKITVSGGNFTALTIPSWFVGTLNLYVVVYKWDTDYMTSLSKAPLFVDLIDAASPGVWKDPGQMDFKLNFDRAFAPGDYLVYFINYGDPMYFHMVDRRADAIAYFDGKEKEGATYEIYATVNNEAALNEQPNIKYDVLSKDTIHPLYAVGASTEGLSNVVMSDVGSVAFRFNLAGEKLKGFVINSLDNGSGDVTLKMYRWKTDYATTKSGKVVFEKTYAASGDPNNSNNCVFNFDDYVFSSGEYLIVLESASDVMLWRHAPKGDVEVYIDNELYTTGSLKVSLVTNMSAEVNEPTAEEPATPTPVPEDKTPTPADPTPSTGNPPAGDAAYGIVFFVMIVAFASAAVIIRKRSRN